MMSARRQLDEFGPFALAHAASTRPSWGRGARAIFSPVHSEPTCRFETAKIRSRLRMVKKPVSTRTNLVRGLIYLSVTASHTTLRVPIPLACYGIGTTAWAAPE